MTTAIQPYVPDADDMGIGRTDDLIQITRVRIDGGKGFFRLSSQPENRDIRQLELVPLYRMPETRALYPERDADNTEPQPPLCVSSNGITPTAIVDLAPYGGARTGPTCALCPYGPSGWTTGEDGRRKPPPCKESMNLAFATVVQGEGIPQPTMLKVSSTSIKGARELVSSLLDRQYASNPAKPIFAFVVRLSGKLIEVKRGNQTISWYQLSGDIIGETDRQAWRAYATLRSRFKSQATQIAALQVAVEAAEDAAGGATAGKFGPDVVMTPPDELPFDRPEDAVTEPADPPQKPAVLLATEAQLKALYKLAEAAHLSEQELGDWCHEKYGVPPEGLRREYASAAIDSFRAKVPTS